MSSIAERYARALFELALEAQQLGPVSDQVRRFADAYLASDELRKVLENPTIEDQTRDALIKDLAARIGAAALATNAVRLLADRRRLRALPEVAEQLQRLSDEKAGIVRATVTSAGLLPETYYAKLVAELEKATKRKIVLEKKEDPSLIAGVVTRIGDRTIDGSLKGRLAALSRSLVAPA